MKRSATLAVVWLGSMVLVSCSSAAATKRVTNSSPALAQNSPECQANKAAGTLSFASPFGYDASAGILDVYAAIKLGYFSDLCLTVDFVDVPPTESPYALLSAGTAQISGIGSAADALAEESSGANVEGIATYGDASDYALLTRPSITNLAQLDGKLLAYHTTLPVVLTEMLTKAGVNLSELRTTNDTTYDPSLLTQGKFDALQAYQSNEPFELQADGDKFTVWTPAQFGVSGTFNVMLANRNFLAQHGGAVADFLRADFYAFNYCVDHAAQCVGFLAQAQGPTFRVALATQEWRYESALVAAHHLAGRGIGVESLAEWEPEAKAVVEYHRVHQDPDLAAAEDTTLAASLYRGSTLIWP